MNKIVNNLAQIAGAAEYFDKKTSAAWKIRNALTNMCVWAANSVVFAHKSEETGRIASASVVLATLRTWARDSNASGFTLDFTPTAVAKTLGLERVVDVHEEAVRTARQKCINARSSLRFKQYYDAAIASYEAQQAERRENVEAISELLSDSSTFVSLDLSSYFDEHGIGCFAPDMSVEDALLYDESAVERQADQIAETVGNALESMYEVCETELASAITTEKVTRLTAHQKAIENMLVITGVDMAKLKERRTKLEALIDAEADKASEIVKGIDAEIEAKLSAEINTVPEPKAPAKQPTKGQRVKKEAAHA